MTTLAPPALGGKHCCGSDAALSLIRRHFLNRTDFVAFAPPWGQDAARAVAGDNLDAMLAAHLFGDQGPAVSVRWVTKAGKSGTETGRFRLGTYSPSISGTTVFAAVDFDGGGRHGFPLVDPLGAALALWLRCKRLGLTAYLEKSGGGKGWHLWIFFAEPVPARDARRLLFALVPRDVHLEDGTLADPEAGRGIEIFPKQDTIPPDGFGNMVWLPWWSAAAEGGNQFHRFDGMGNMTPYMPDAFTVISAAALAQALDKVYRPKKPRAETTGHHQSNGTPEARVPTATLLGCALARSKGARNDRGFWLACQLRDNTYSKDEARPVLDEYQTRQRDAGNHEYTAAEALASLDQAYSRPPRDPWTLPRLLNYREEQDGETTIKIGLSAAEIGKHLDRLTGGWPKRVGAVPFVPGDHHAPLWLESTDALFARVSAELSGGRGDNPISWVGGQDKVTQAQFYQHLTQSAEEFAAVEPYPHFPVIPHHYYMHPPVRGGDGRALDGLLRRFRPATRVDRHLIRAFFLTLFWGGKPGQRPAFLIDAGRDKHAGRGVGKTKLVQAAAHLAGGHIDARPNEEIDKLLTRLLSPAALDRRVILLDNVKALKFSWGDLEALVTADTISGRRLYQGEGRRPNTLLWCITSNKATLSKDMAQRCVIIRVKRPRHDPTWEPTTFAYIDEHRWEIIGDILAELQRPVPRLHRCSRWGSWEQAVLAHVGNRARCQKVIRARQRRFDADQEEAQLVRDRIEKRLRQHDHDPAVCVVWLSTAEVAFLVNDATGEFRPHNKASAFLGTLGIPELKKSNRAHGRGWTWHGRKAPPNAAAGPLKKPDPPGDAK
jgi:hypothetical protein